MSCPAGSPAFPGEEDEPCRPAVLVAESQKRFLRLPDPIKALPRLPVQRLCIFDGFGHQSESTAGGVAFDAAPFAIGQLAQENLDHVVEKAGSRRPDADDGRTGETPTPATGFCSVSKVLKVIGGAGASAFNLHRRAPH